MSLWPALRAPLRRRLIQRSLSGLLAVFMSLHGLVAATGMLEATPAHDESVKVSTANSGSLPCHDMAPAMADESAGTDLAANEDCGGDCCDQGRDCDMSLCLAGGCLPMAVPASLSIPRDGVVPSMFPSPSLGRIASAHGPPLRPPIA